MKCEKCGNEWVNQPGQSVNFCLTCGERLQSSTPTSPENVIKSLVLQHGEGVLLDARLLSLVSDMLQNKSPQILKRIRLAINEKVPQAIFGIKDVSEQDRAFKITAIVTSLRDEYGMEADVAYEIVNYFCEALGFKGITPPIATVKPQAPPPKTTPKQQSSPPMPPPTPKTQYVAPTPQYKPPINQETFKIGSIITFGKYNWCLLDIQGDKALLLSERLIEHRYYHQSFVTITWGACDLRDYLNGGNRYRGQGLYDTFSLQEQRQIVETRVEGSDNPWYGTRGGNASIDKVFLLSIEEVVKYLGDSGQLRYKNTSTGFLDDSYNQARIAKNRVNVALWWWLRGPGVGQNYASFVYGNSKIDIRGDLVNTGSGGIRPAMWVYI